MPSAAINLPIWPESVSMMMDHGSASAQMDILLSSLIGAVLFAETAEDQRGQNSEDARRQECLMAPVMISPAAIAMPKLIEGCCMVLAMALALLARLGPMSPWANVFMLVYWSAASDNICRCRKQERFSGVGIAITVTEMMA